MVEDEQVRARFPDGIVWVTLGSEITDTGITARQEDIYLAFTGNRAQPPFKDAVQGKEALKRALAGKACLLVVDDVWEAKHLEAFDCLATTTGKGLLLFTSRFDLAKSKARTIKVGAIKGFTGPTARAMLLSYTTSGETCTPREGAPGGDGAVGGASGGGGGGGGGGSATREGDAPPHQAVDKEQEDALERLLHLCKGLPLAIAIMGSLKTALGPDGTWTDLLQLVERDRGEALDFPPDADSAASSIYQGLYQALAASVAQLEASTDKYDRLAASVLGFYGVWVEDTWMELPVVTGVWGLASEAEAKLVLGRLASRSLIEVDGRWRSVAHDLLRDYLRARDGPQMMARRHIDTVTKGCTSKPQPAGLRLDGKQPPYPERYFWQHVAAALAVWKDDVQDALKVIWPRVTHICFEDTPKNTISWFWHHGLQHCTALQVLDLRDYQIGDDGARALAEGLQH